MALTKTKRVRVTMDFVIELAKGEVDSVPHFTGKGRDVLDLIVSGIGDAIIDMGGGTILPGARADFRLDNRKPKALSADDDFGREDNQMKAPTASKFRGIWVADESLSDHAQQLLEEAACICDSVADQISVEARRLDKLGYTNGDLVGQEWAARECARRIRLKSA